MIAHKNNIGQALNYFLEASIEASTSRLETSLICHQTRFKLGWKQG